MTDQITRLLERYATELTLGALAPPAPVPASRDLHWRRRYLLPAAAAAAVVTIAAGVVVATGRVSDRPPSVYAVDGPELGTAELPVDVTGKPSGAGARPGATPVGPSELLATGENRKGTAALLGQHYSDGALCLVVGYLPPASNQGSTWSCDARGHDPWATAAIVMMGEGPGGAPGGIKDPAIAYGSAPAGTRQVELTSADAATVTARAYDGGPGYEHRAFFMATWDLAVKTSARALGEDGRVLATLDFPFHPATPEAIQAQCKGIRLAMRGHFQRAIGLAGKKANRGDARPIPVVQDASTDDGANAMLTAAIRDVALMGSEERYEYRLAANVVTGEAQCFTAAAPLRAVALEYQSVSR